MEKHPNNHHHSERLEKLEAKAHEEKSVAGHPMPAAGQATLDGKLGHLVGHEDGT